MSQGAVNSSMLLKYHKIKALTLLAAHFPDQSLDLRTVLRASGERGPQPQVGFHLADSKHTQFS